MLQLVHSSSLVNKRNANSGIVVSGPSHKSRPDLVNEPIAELCAASSESSHTLAEVPASARTATGCTVAQDATDSHNYAQGAVSRVCMLLVGTHNQPQHVAFCGKQPAHVHNSDHGKQSRPPMAGDHHRELIRPHTRAPICPHSQGKRGHARSHHRSYRPLGCDGMYSATGLCNRHTTDKSTTSYIGPPLMWQRSGCIHTVWDRLRPELCMYSPTR